MHTTTEGWAMVRRTALVRVALLGLASASCAGLGPLGSGGLQLNVSDVQSREVTIRVTGPSSDARLVEFDGVNETDLGQGSASIERYVIQRVVFGRGLASGLFLCIKPCTRPLDAFLVAYSSDQLFEPTGELRLRIRVLREGAPVEELSRIITPQALPDLWGQPIIEVPSTR